MDNRCKKCLLREMSETGVDIEKYKNAIKPADRADETLYEERLNICKSCDRLNAGTCFSCGCYVELRAYAQNANCPNKKW